ncbi:HpcH/HpaI aldolase/citrate lyase family protein [Nesterenkonia haasae]|uniref:HpcH/HpaI aldolase/citrate lyase family protein n=1 Tax=Nesterenkonia haasae TaxID=2587813 RepID=UPI001391EFE3|nr:CoA ester lyase [Nesterenkonia haasae]NDK31028.1 CoA ester lyase [Nesterenkonia haasae]
MNRSDDIPFTLGPALLFCPADRPDRFGKAAERSDAVILDLEDAVAPEDKARARQSVAEYLSGIDPELASRTVVRMNPVGTSDFAADARVLADFPPEHVMLAKTESAEDVQAVHSSFPSSQVIALCETAAGGAAAYEIADHPATSAIMWGAEDLMVSIGGTSSRHPDGSYRDIARHVRSTILLAAASRGKAAVDSIYADIKDTHGLSVEAADAVGSGFAAKACIHPSQVAAIRDAFLPTDEEAEYAQALLEEARHHGGAFQFRGGMIDAPLLRHAERIAQRAVGVRS